MKQQERAQQLIEEQYGKSFVIHECTFQADGKHHLLASPADNPEIKFEFTYTESADKIYSFYPVYLWEYDATSTLKEKLKGHYADRFTGKAEPMNRQKMDDKNLPAYATLVDKYPEQQDIYSRIYIFRDINNDNKEEILKGIIDYVDYYQQKKVAITGYEISFFDEKHFAAKDLTEFQFGFNKVGPESFERNNMDYFQGKMIFEMKAASPTPNAEQIFAIYNTDRYHRKSTKF